LTIPSPANGLSKNVHITLLMPRYRDVQATMVFANLNALETSLFLANNISPQNAFSSVIFLEPKMIYKVYLGSLFGVKITYLLVPMHQVVTLRQDHSLFQTLPGIAFSTAPSDLFQPSQPQSNIRLPHNPDDV
jgi:hypothetical protein